MDEYEAIMEACATNPGWFTEIKSHLIDSRSSSPLFDTDRWVKNLEAGLIEISSQSILSDVDILVTDEEEH